MIVGQWSEVRQRNYVIKYQSLQTNTYMHTERPPLVNQKGKFGADGWNPFSPTANNNKCTEIDAAFVL